MNAQDLYAILAHLTRAERQEIEVFVQIGRRGWRKALQRRAERLPGQLILFGEGVSERLRREKQWAPAESDSSCSCSSSPPGQLPLLVEQQPRG